MPASQLECLHSLEKIKMTTPNRAGLLRFFTKANALIDGTPEAVRPPPKKVVKTLLNAMTPARLVERLKLDIPETITVLIRRSLVEMEEIENFHNEMVSHPISQSSIKPHAKPAPKGVTKPTRSEDRMDRCFGCGNTGHLRSNCPFKGTSGFIPAPGKRHTPLSFALLSGGHMSAPKSPPTPSVSYSANLACPRCYACAYAQSPRRW